MNNVLLSICHGAQAFIYRATEGSDENVLMQSNLFSNVQVTITVHVSGPSLHTIKKKITCFKVIRTDMPSCTQKALLGAQSSESIMDDSLSRTSNGFFAS